MRDRRHAVKDIAFQAGLSRATVDRAVHGRSGVRAATSARVAAAIAELDRQSDAAGLSARSMAIDVVMEAPNRFAREVRAAFEAEAPALRPASLRVRFHVAERFAPGAMARVLRRLRRRGTDGIALKAEDAPDVRDAAARRSR